MARNQQSRAQQHDAGPPQDRYAQERTQLTSLQSFLGAGKEQLAKAIQRNMDPDRLLRLALNAAARNHDLLKCSGVSIARSLMQAGAVGLEPDGREGHLVPFWNGKNGCMEAVFMPDYKGFVKLAYQSNLISSIEAHAVHEGDEFDFQFGTNASLRHVPNLKATPGPTYAAWCMVTFRDGRSVFHVMTLDEINARRAVSKSKDSGPWANWFDEMAVKSCFKVLSKMLPMGPNFRAAIEIDDGAEIGDVRLPSGVGAEILDQIDAPARGGDAIEHQPGVDNPIPRTASQQVRDMVRNSRPAPEPDQNADAGRGDVPESDPVSEPSEPPERVQRDANRSSKPKADPLLKLPSESIDQWAARMSAAIPLIPALEELDRLESEIVPGYVESEFLGRKVADMLVGQVEKRIAELESTPE